MWWLLPLGWWDGASGSGPFTPPDTSWRSVAAQAYVAGSQQGEDYTAGAVASQAHLAGSTQGEFA